jgi:hypothetical protein
MQRETTSSLVNEYSFDGKGAEPAAAEAPRPYQPPVADANGVIFFDSVGVRLQLTKGWSASEETTPMPNVAMLSFSKAEYAQRQQTGMPGEVPVVLMSIEDISNEGIPIDEFREKSKMMALTQMQMMTNGMFQPNVLEDTKLAEPIGPFTHSLMYELKTPYFGMQVMNLTAVIEGLAYILQVMCNAQEFTAVRKEAVNMAKTAAIARRAAPADFRTVSAVTATSQGGSVAMPPSWTLEKATASNPIFVLTTASQSRAESVEVHKADASGAVDLSKAQAKSSKDIRGVTVTDYGTTMRVATSGNVVVVCNPKHSGSVVTTAETLASICESVNFSATADDDKLTYHSEALKLGFNLHPKGKIIESRVSERILVYAPLGLPKEPSDEMPMLTVRVGDPSNDPDCRTSYDEWLSRIQEETDGESTTDLKKDTVNGMECVTFVSKEMQEVGPGQKEERTAKVIILLSGIRTTMLRWETPSGAWRKFEGKLKSVLNSLRID